MSDVSSDLRVLAFDIPPYIQLELVILLYMMQRFTTGEGPRVFQRGSGERLQTLLQSYNTSSQQSSGIRSGGYRTCLGINWSVKSDSAGMQKKH